MQLQMVLLGVPPKAVIESAPRKHVFFSETGKPKPVNGKKKRPGSSSVGVVTRINDADLLDLLSKCFKWDQHERITAKDALSHPFFAVKDEGAKLTAKKPGKPKPTSSRQASPRRKSVGRWAS